MARVWKFGSDVDTDQIVPGRFSPFMRPGEDVGKAAFIEAHPEFNQTAQPGDIIVAGDNFGCGSSREYAPLALKRRKVGAILACSFARIFYRNSINLGIPIFIAPNLVGVLEDGDQVILDLPNAQLKRGENEFDLPVMPEFIAEVIAYGGIVQYVRKKGHFPGEEP
jgi:methanogen homoaconitase small subunit